MVCGGISACSRGGEVFCALTVYLQVSVCVCVCVCLCVCIRIHSVSFPLPLCKIVYFGRFRVLTFSDLLSSLHTAESIDAYGIKVTQKLHLIESLKRLNVSCR